MEFKKGDKVSVMGTDMQGKVIQIGAKGLVMINITTDHSAFDRTIYHSRELAIID